MNFLIIFVAILTISATLANPVDISDESSMSVSDSAAEEIVENSKIILELVQNLRKIANEVMDAIRKFNSEVHDEFEIFSQKVMDDIALLGQGVVDAARAVIDTIQSAAGKAVIKCVESYEAQANELFFNTTRELFSCGDSVTSEISTLAETAVDAISYADQVVDRLTNCTNESSNALLRATCLGTVVVEAQVQSGIFVVQSGRAIVKLNIAIATLPSTLQSCATSKMVEASLRTAGIIFDIGKCSLLSYIFHPFDTSN